MKPNDTIAKRKLPSDLAEIWSCKDMAEHFGRSAKTIGYVIRSREIEAVARIGAKKFFDMPAVELVAIALAEIEAIKGVSERLERIEQGEREVAAGLRKAKAEGNKHIVSLRMKQRDLLQRARRVIELADEKINLTPIA